MAGKLQVSCTIVIIKGRAHVYGTSCMTLKTINNKISRSHTSYFHCANRLALRYLPIATALSLCYSSVIINLLVPELFF